MKIFLSLLMVAVLCSCQTTKQVASLATPDNVKIVVTVGGSAIISKVTDGDKAILHRVATTLLALTSATVDETTINGIQTLVPQLSNPYAKVLVQGALVNLNMALTAFGSHNTKIVAYTKAVGEGLVAAGF